jgi:hypothetical protein
MDPVELQLALYTLLLWLAAGFAVVIVALLLWDNLLPPRDRF